MNLNANLEYILKLQKTANTLKQNTKNTKTRGQIQEENKSNEGGFENLLAFLKKINDGQYVEKRDLFFKKIKDDIESLSNPSAQKLSPLLCDLRELLKNVENPLVDEKWDPIIFISQNENEYNSLFDKSLKEYMEQKKATELLLLIEHEMKRKSGLKEKISQLSTQQ